VQVLGSGTASPSGQKFPGAYNWRDPGLLVNIHFHDKSYVCHPFQITASPIPNRYTRSFREVPSTKGKRTLPRVKSQSSTKQERFLANKVKITKARNMSTANVCWQALQQTSVTARLERGVAYGKSVIRLQSSALRRIPTAKAMLAMHSRLVAQCMWRIHRRALS
jgi:hypothetical protein